MIHLPSGKRASRPTSLLFLVVLLLSTGHAACRHTSDMEIELLLRGHREEIGRLVAMAQADDEAGRLYRYIDRSSVLPANADHQGLSPESWNRYQDLLRETGISGVAGDGKPVWFRVDPPSLRYGDTEKGFIYSQDPLTPDLSSLDDFLPWGDTGVWVNGSYFGYKRIQSNWYLYLAYY